MKWTSKDYNNQLEKVLGEKEFSEDVKNLLLSMLYKIEAGYKDYSTTKRNVENKNEYIEKLINIIKDECYHINIVSKNINEQEDEEELRKNRYIVYPLEKKIELFYPNEKNLLYAIFEMNNTSVYFDEDYNLCRVALSELLNIGENINNIEVLRDFNGWSWNVLPDEISNISINLMYQNLIFLVGVDEISKWIHQVDIPNYVEIVKEKVKKIYGKDNADRIFESICRISIIECIKNNKKEKERLIQEKQDLKIVVDVLNNKRELLESIYREKKEALKEVKQIDKTISDKQLLEEEFKRRNKTLPQYNQIFSLTHLTEILNKQRRKILEKIEAKNKMLDPKYYVELKDKKEKQYNLLQTAGVEETGEFSGKFYVVELQKIIIECYEIRIQKAIEKNDIIDLIYMLRYYKYLYVNRELLIKNIIEIKKDIEEIENKLIDKAMEQKVLLKISDDKNLNYEILRNIFNTKMISIENMNMQLKEDDSKENIVVEIYDDKLLENSIKITEVQDKKSIKVKFNKLFEIFS